MTDVEMYSSGVNKLQSKSEQHYYTILYLCRNISDYYININKNEFKNIQIDKNYIPKIPAHYKYEVLVKLLMYIKKCGMSDGKAGLQLASDCSIDDLNEFVYHISKKPLPQDSVDKILGIHNDVCCSFEVSPAGTPLVSTTVVHIFGCDKKYSKFYTTSNEVYEIGNIVNKNRIKKKLSEYIINNFIVNKASGKSYCDFVIHPNKVPIKVEVEKNWIVDIY